MAYLGGGTSRRTMQDARIEIDEAFSVGKRIGSSFLLKTSSFLIMPGKVEGFGYSLWEARYSDGGTAKGASNDLPESGPGEESKTQGDSLHPERGRPKQLARGLEAGFHTETDHPHQRSEIQRFGEMLADVVGRPLNRFTRPAIGQQALQAAPRYLAIQGLLEGVLNSAPERSDRQLFRAVDGEEWNRDHGTLAQPRHQGHPVLIAEDSVQDDRGDGNTDRDIRGNLPRGGPGRPVGRVSPSPSPS
jgi:hypothetical protein